MIIVLGLGQMGKSAASALAKLGNRVTAIDKDEKLTERCQEDFDKSWERGEHIKITCASEEHPFSQKIDCVLSCLPYHQNVGWAKLCIDNSIPYCDLGGDPPVEAEIKALAKDAKAPLFLSLGLAPGLVNIITEHLIQKHGIPKDIRMYVGGLPKNLWYGPYQRTWSVEGLYNEYKKPCLTLLNGEIKEVPALSEPQELDETYESFYTSGGISHSLERFKALGIKHALYSTIRYKGHCSQIRPLIDNLDREECIKVFEKIFPKTNEDFVKMKIEMFYWDSGTVKIEYNHCWYSDWKETAMQKCTAYPAAAIVHMIVNDPIKYVEGNQKMLLDYSDVDFEIFSGHLSRLGLLP